MLAITLAQLHTVGKPKPLNLLTATLQHLRA